MTGKQIRIIAFFACLKYWLFFLFERICRKRLPVKRWYAISTFIFLCLSVPVAGHSFELNTTCSEGFIRISSQYRSLSPGEVIKINVDSSSTPDLRALLDGREYAFYPSTKGSHFALIGLEIDTRPGLHTLTINASFPKGTKKTFSFKINIKNDQFPSQKIKVSRKFTAPSSREIDRIKKEVKLLQRIYKEKESTWLVSDNFIIPSEGTVRNNFGERRIFNDTRRSQHKGTDIRSPMGSKVRASNSGGVVLARDLFFGGNTVIIDHGSGLFSIYCHLSKIRVREGQKVSLGELIGRVGATGRVTGPHLHWGFKLHGEYVNPLSILHIPFG